MEQSPSILHVEWRVILAAGIEPVRGLNLWPGGGRAWDWRETDTHHVPEVQTEDVDELVSNGPHTVVLDSRKSSSSGF